METRRFGRTGLQITPVGFGAWAIGGGDWRYGWGTQDDDASIAAIRRAVAGGVNWIDTAAAYGLGHSEEVVARALAAIPPSERPLVFTKCALVPAGDGGDVTESLDPASLRRECEASLRRLRVEAIDLYQVHWPTDRIEEIDAGWATLRDLVREGKVRHLGVSNFGVEELERAERIAPVETIQPPYSLLRRGVETDVLPWARAHDAGVIVYSPMESGLLTGTMTRERIAALPENDWRSRSERFREPMLSRAFAVVEAARRIADARGATPAQVAIAWTLRDPVVTGAIVGARDAAQVEGWLPAGALRLAPDEIAALERAAA